MTTKRHFWMIEELEDGGYIMSKHFEANVVNLGDWSEPFFRRAVTTYDDLNAILNDNVLRVEPEASDDPEIEDTDEV